MTCHVHIKTHAFFFKKNVHLLFLIVFLKLYDMNHYLILLQLYLKPSLKIAVSNIIVEHL